MLCGPSGFYVVANVAVSDLNNYSKRNEIRQFKPTAAYPRMYSIRLPPTHLLLCSQFNIPPESELFPRGKPFVLVPVWSRGVGNAMRNVTRVRWDSSSTRAGRQSRHKSRCTRRERQDGGRISYLDSEVQCSWRAAGCRQGPRTRPSRRPPLLPCSVDGEKERESERERVGRRGLSKKSIVVLFSF